MPISSRFPSLDASEGFTLIEIMIVVAIVAILAAIAIPNYFQYARRSQRIACVANLKALEQAIEQCRLAGNTAVPTMALICEPIGYIKGEPRCPTDNNGHYDISGEVPLCPNRASYPDHTIVVP